MASTDIANISDHARIWVFGISPALDRAGQEQLLARIDPFLEEWSAHGHPITAAREIRDGMFLIVAVEQSAQTSGCSIDRLFGTLRQLERDLGVAILDAGRIFFRHGDGRIDAISRARFAATADPHTIVFDTTAERLSDIRSGSWEKPAAQSWHRALFCRSDRLSDLGSVV